MLLTSRAVMHNSSSSNLSPATTHFSRGGGSSSLSQVMPWRNFTPFARVASAVNFQLLMFLLRRCCCRVRLSLPPSFVSHTRSPLLLLHPPQYVRVCLANFQATGEKSDPISTLDADKFQSRLPYSLDASMLQEKVRRVSVGVCKRASRGIREREHLPYISFEKANI